MKDRVRIEPGIGIVGSWACGPVKSAEALPTSHIKSESLPKPRCRSRLAGTSVEVGTETADFNVLQLPNPTLHDDVLDVSALPSLKYK